MKLPEFILHYARTKCDMKEISTDNIFRLVKMLFENRFNEEEIEVLLIYIEELKHKYRDIIRNL